MSLITLSHTYFHFSAVSFIFNSEMASLGLATFRRREALCGDWGLLFDHSQS